MTSSVLGLHAACGGGDVENEAACVGQDTRIGSGPVMVQRLVVARSGNCASTRRQRLEQGVPHSGLEVRAGSIPLGRQSEDRFGRTRLDRLAPDHGNLGRRRRMPERDGQAGVTCHFQKAFDPRTQRRGQREPVPIEKPMRNEGPGDCIPFDAFEQSMQERLGGVPVAGEPSCAAQEDAISGGRRLRVAGVDELQGKGFRDRRRRCPAPLSMATARCRHLLLLVRNDKLFEQPLLRYQGRSRRRRTRDPPRSTRRRSARATP